MARTIVLRDRDGSYGYQFSGAVGWPNLQEGLTAPRSPWQNAYIETSDWLHSTGVSEPRHRVFQQIEFLVGTTARFRNESMNARCILALSMPGRVRATAKACWKFLLGELCGFDRPRNRLQLILSDLGKSLHLFENIGRGERI